MKQKSFKEKCSDAAIVRTEALNFLLKLDNAEYVHKVYGKDKYLNHEDGKMYIRNTNGTFEKDIT